MRALPVALLLAGCAPPEPVELLDPYGLTPVAAGADPLADHRPVDDACPEAAWGEEGGGFEIQTGVCSYAAFAGPLPVLPEAGDALVVSVWHDLLDAAPPATAHLAVLLGEEVVWEAWQVIPAPSGVLEHTVTLTSSAAPDATLGLHLHNHGFNSWRFVSVELRPR